MRRIKPVLVLMVALIFTFTFTALPVSASEVYHITNDSYSWFPSSNTSAYDTSAYSMTSSDACVEGVLYSSTTPITIKVVLQKIGPFGIVIGESNVSYNVTYSGGQTTNLRTGQPVTGKYFRLYFSNLSSGSNYRVRFCDPSSTVSIGLTNVYFYNR